jgi:hypothetical protein
MARIPSTGLDCAQREFVKLLEANTRRYRRHEVFRDFCELAALSISNTVDKTQFAVREARYLEIVRRYDRAEVDRFPAMLSSIVESLTAQMSDCLGQLFMAMKLGDHWKGQFFTPYEIAYLMAKITIGDVATVIERNGFFTLNEPAAGAGAMVIAAANAILDQGHNYQQTMHVITTDINPTAVHMTYIQLSLLHIPAIVIHGNGLFPDPDWGHWKTPAHILGLWDARLRRRVPATADARAAVPAVIQISPAAPPRPEQGGQFDLFGT